MKSFLEKHILSVTLVPLCILFVGASYVRFMVINDYLVSYEVTCDPAVQACFVGCEDEECSNTYPYYIVEKQAAELERQCGKDVSNCEMARVCTSEDSVCSVTMCDLASEDCYTENSSDQTNLNETPNSSDS